MPDARATVGRLVPTPGGTNVIASTVDLWLDARVPGAGTSAAGRRDQPRRRGRRRGGRLPGRGDPGVLFGRCGVRRRLRDDLGGWLGGPPELPTGAGHDAAILAGFVPAGMLYVRNPTGISHSPEEFAEADDVEAGAAALATVLERLAR